MAAAARHEHRLDVVEEDDGALLGRGESGFGVREQVEDALFALTVARTRDLAAVDQRHHDVGVAAGFAKALRELEREPLSECGLSGARRPAQKEALHELRAGVRRTPLVFDDLREFAQDVPVALADDVAAEELR